MSFEPKILGFLCNWCSYSAADSAGAAHMSYAPNVRIIRVMCTGRVDPALVMHALTSGADGVLICGCHPGDCHYINGNCKALGRFTLLKRMLVDLGLEPDRLRLEWVGATESARFSEVINEMTEQVRAIGPLRWPSIEGGSTGEEERA